MVSDGVRSVQQYHQEFLLFLVVLFLWVFFQNVKKPYKLPLSNAIGIVMYVL